LLITDPAESSGADVNGVQPQYDVISLYGGDDNQFVFYRWDTVSNTVYSNAEYVKVCLDLPNVVGGDTVPGCSSISTDILIYIFLSGSLNARVINCTVQNCAQFPGGIGTYTAGIAAYSGTTTEVRLPRSSIGFTPDNKPNVVVFFDNGDIPQDDRIPDSGVVEYAPAQCTVDCLGVTNGNASYDECGVCNGDGTSCWIALEFLKVPRSTTNAVSVVGMVKAVPALFLFLKLALMVMVPTGELMTCCGLTLLSPLEAEKMTYNLNGMLFPCTLLTMVLMLISDGTLKPTLSTVLLNLLKFVSMFLVFLAVTLFLVVVAFLPTCLSTSLAKMAEIAWQPV
jgi:hypothetical protein